MANTINERYVDKFIDRLRDRLEDLDADLQDVAAASQRAYRRDLQAGQTVRSYKPTTVIGDAYEERARLCEDRARRDISAMFDRLDRDALADRTEAASADEIATVQLALSLNPDEATLRDLWEAHGKNATLRAAIRHAAIKAEVFLPATISDTVADNREDAREYALRQVNGRWTPSNVVELAVTPSARIDAESVMQHLLGVDIFGNPL